MKKLTLVVFLLVCVIALGAVPRNISFQGKLAGVSSPVNLRFGIWTAPSGGSELWFETISGVILDGSGLFNVYLGDVTPIPLDFSVPYWIGVTINGTTTLPSRYRITSDGYAFRAIYSDTVNWAGIKNIPAGFADGIDDVGSGLPAGTNGQTLRNNGSGWVANSIIYNDGTNVGIGTTTPTRKLEVSGGANVAVYATGSANTAGYFNNTSTSLDNYGVFGVCNNTPFYGFGGYFVGGYIGVLGEANLAGVSSRFGVKGTASGGATDNYALYGEAYGDAGTKYAVYGTASGTGTNWAGYFAGNGYFSGNLGIGTTTPFSKLDVTGSINASSGFKYNNTAPSGEYLRGNGTNFVSSTIQSGDIPSGSANYIQNQFASYQSASWKILGQSQCSTSTASAVAIKGIATGSAVIGVRGLGPSGGYGVAGYSDTTVVTGMGVLGRARNTAILGKSEYNKGVYGYAFDDDGVYGYALGTTLYRYAGVNGQGGSDSTYGVKGMATVFPGVYGQNSSTKYAAVVGRNTMTSVGSSGVAGYGDTVNVAAYGVFGLARYHGVYGRSKYYNGVRGEAIDDNGVSGYYSGTNTSYAGVWGGRGSYGYGVYYSGGLAGSGAKSCVMRTSEGPVALYCQESPENWFEDFGEAQLINGHIRVNLDNLFMETVTINDQYPIKVFVSLRDDCNGVYVKTDKTGFDIYELQHGTSNAALSYRVVAKRRGFEDYRLKIENAGYNDPVLYPDPNDPQIPQEIRAKRLETQRIEAQFGGQPPQPQPSNPTPIEKPTAPGMEGLPH